MTTPDKTSNPIGSTAPIDMNFNAWLFDQLLNSTGTKEGRLGKILATWDEAVSRLGYVVTSGFEFGQTFTITDRNEVVLDASTGNFYIWTLALPKSVTPSDQPTDNGWEVVSDAALRTALAADDGETLIGNPNTVSAMVALTIPAGSRISTKGYYAVGDGGQAEYVSRGQGWPVAADGLINHADAGGNFLELQLEGGRLSALQCGCRGDATSSDSDAAQNMIDYWNQISATTPSGGIHFPRPSEAYRLTKPMWFYQKDGMKLTGDGPHVTRFLIDGNLDMTLPPEFSAIDGQFKGYTYGDEPAMIIIAARRVAQNSGFNAANGAAWFLEFGGFSLECTGNAVRTVSLARGPEIGNSKFFDITTYKVKYGNFHNDSYASHYEDLRHFECQQPIKILEGTSNNIETVTTAACVLGYEISSMYTTLTNVTIDHWGQRFNNEPDPIPNAYAYDLKGTGMVLNGCGLEYGWGGLLRVANRPSASVTLNGCTFIGGALDEGRGNFLNQSTAADFGCPSGMIFINDARVSFNNTAIRSIVHQGGVSGAPIEKLNAEVSGISEVILNSLGGRESTEALIRSRWLMPNNFNTQNEEAEICVLNNRDKARCYVKTDGAVSFSGDGTTNIMYGSVEVDNYSQYSSVTGEYTVPVTGWYSVNINLSYSGTGVIFTFVRVVGENADILEIPAAATNESVSQSAPVYLRKGERIFSGIRHGAGSSGSIQPNASFKVIAM